jgi:hypothetical protein
MPWLTGTPSHLSVSSVDLIDSYNISFFVSEAFDYLLTNVQNAQNKWHWSLLHFLKQLRHMPVLITVFKTAFLG